MRQMIFWVIMLVFNTSCATAQQYSSSYDDVYSNNSEYVDDESAYNVVLDDDIALDENRQWHYDDYSVLGANNGQYVLLRGTDRYRYSLGTLNYSAYSNLWGETIYERNCRPYYYNNQFGWFVYGNRCTYFVYPDGTYAIFRDRYYPRYYSYRYPYHYGRYGHSRCLNIFSWHFWSGRHHRDYHGHCYDRPRVSHHDNYRTNRSSYGNSRSNSSYRNASTRNAETRRSSINSTRTRSASGSNYQRSENSSRRSSSSYSQPSTRSRSESSYSRSSSSSRPSSSYSRSSSSSVSTRSSSGSSSRSSATSSGSSRRR